VIVMPAKPALDLIVGGNPFLFSFILANAGNYGFGDGFLPSQE
jgi:hypothetical protein